ncbi:hypothetical protein [Luteolibacter algae]
MKIHAFSIVVGIAAIVGIVGCKKTLLEFEERGRFVQRERTKLAAIVTDIQKQNAVKRLIWSDGREFVTVIRRDDVVEEGYVGDRKFQPEIGDWMKRLKASGCHGFNDDRIDGLTILYLDISTHIAVPTAEQFKDQYSAWAKAGKDPEGMRCIDLGHGWYLATDNN